MKRLLGFALMATLLPAAAVAQDSGKYQCTYGELQRRVEIAHEPGVEVPCSVHYYKDSEAPGEQQVLWSAERDPTYCRTKAAEFITKLEGWGWDCGRGADAPAEEGAVEEAVEEAAEEAEEMLGTMEEEVVKDDE